MFACRSLQLYARRRRRSTLRCLHTRSRVFTSTFASGSTYKCFKAVVARNFGGPEQVQVEEDVSLPEPEASQVIVQLDYAGVNPVDTYILSGTYATKPELPYTPGKDGAGTVVAAHDSVKHVKVGDKVYLSGSQSGTYAQFALCGAQDVHPLPSHLSTRAGAAIGVASATAYRALFQRAQAMAGEWVLVHGATGAVGRATLALAVDAGMKTIATAGSEHGVESLLQAGASCVVRHGQGDAIVDQVLECTNGAGVDVVIEMLANVNLEHDLQLLAPGGRVAVVGNRGTVSINPRNLMGREAQVMGVMLYAATPKERAAMFAGVQAKLHSGALTPDVGVEFPLQHASHALVEVIEHATHGGAAGKVVICCHNNGD